MRKLKNLPYPFLAIFFLAMLAAFLGGYSLRAWQTDRVDPRYPLVREAESLIDEYYIGQQLDLRQKQYGMIEGFIRRLGDPHSAFFEPVTHELQMDSLSGEYGGIGVHLMINENGDVYLNPFPDSPAARSGIRAGDLLLSVDGTQVQDFDNLDHILATFHGPIGSKVTLVLHRQDSLDPHISLEILRETINTPSVTGSLVTEDPAIGVIKINTITERTADEVEQEFTELVGLGMQALVLDLRANPGGILDEAIDIARFFLSEGVVLIERHSEEEETIYEVRSAGLGSDVPLALLVDGGTASAAEAIAAALQTNGRAPLFGTRTFGKGSVQIVLELSDGSSLHITNAHWYTPGGNTYNGMGLSPDYQVELLEEVKDPGLSAAIHYLSERNEETQ
jgi:carboxyl-terminal processing protease